MYGEAKEVLPYYAPTPPGDYVRTTYCVGAKLLCDQITGRSITVVLHLVNKTQVVWYYKKQSTVYTATYGSEFFSYRICVEKIIYLSNTLQYLGVPIIQKRYMFVDRLFPDDTVHKVTSKHPKIYEKSPILRCKFLHQYLGIN